MVLVVLALNRAFQGADADAEQLSLTEQLFDAAMGELGVVSWRQPCMLVGDCNVEPSNIPCLANAISAGRLVDLEASWALACGGQPTPTSKRAWNSGGDHRRDVMVGCPLATAAVLSCIVRSGRWIASHLARQDTF